jgi:hypothetical protein
MTLVNQLILCVWLVIASLEFGVGVLYLLADKPWMFFALLCWAASNLGLFMAGDH